MHVIQNAGAAQTDFLCSWDGSVEGWDPDGYAHTLRFLFRFLLVTVPYVPPLIPNPLSFETRKVCYKS